MMIWYWEVFNLSVFTMKNLAAHTTTPALSTGYWRVKYCKMIRLFLIKLLAGVDREEKFWDSLSCDSSSDDEMRISLPSLPPSLPPSDVKTRQMLTTREQMVQLSLTSLLMKAVRPWTLRLETRPGLQHSDWASSWQGQQTWLQTNLDPIIYISKWPQHTIPPTILSS